MIVRRAVIALFRLYKTVVSPWLPAACRFEPTCSQYAIEAVELHGTVRGLVLTVKRLATSPADCPPTPSATTPR